MEQFKRKERKKWIGRNGGWIG